MIFGTRMPQAVAALIVVVTAILAARTSFAQPVFTNPPCAGVAVVNNHPSCTASLNFVTIPAGVWPPFTLAAGLGQFLPVPVGGVTVRGLILPGGGAVVLNPPPAPAPCSATAWWATNVPLGPLPTCLFTVCVDPASCSITLW